MTTLGTFHLPIKSVQGLFSSSSALPRVPVSELTIQAGRMAVEKKKRCCLVRYLDIVRKSASPKGPGTNRASTTSDDHAQEQADFIDAPDRIISLLPDEMRISDLSKPIEVRAQGRRSSGKSVFEPEHTRPSSLTPGKSFQVVLEDDQSCTRDDIVQYACAVPDLQDKLSTMSFAHTIRLSGVDC